MVKRFHGSRRFIFTGSWSATHVLLSFVGSELPRGLGAYLVCIVIFIQCNQCTMFIRKNKIIIIIIQPVDGATDGATRRVICPASYYYETLNSGQELTGVAVLYACLPTRPVCLLGLFTFLCSLWIISFANNFTCKNCVFSQSLSQ